MVFGCSDSTGPNDSRLRIWAVVKPTVASISDTSVALTIQIHAFNPHFVTVRLKGGPPYVFTSDPTKSQGLEEEFVIGNDANPSNAGPNTAYFGQHEYVFPPFYGEYTEEIITWKKWRAGGWPLVPGTYRVRSFYNGREGSSATFTLNP